MSHGVGMPAWMHLHLFATIVIDAFGYAPFLMGSAAVGKDWRDVDVRVIVPDDWFAEQFGTVDSAHPGGERWTAMCMAFSALGTKMTGLPIDFQIQPESLVAGMVRVELW